MKHLREQSRESMETKVAANGGSLKSNPGMAKGGAAKKAKAPTKINVIVAPRGKEQPVPVPIPVEAPAGSDGVTSPSRQQVPAGIAGLAGPMKNAGGRVKRAGGGRVGTFSAGAGSGEGRLEKTEHQKRRK